MIALGETQKLIVVQKVDFGIYLAEDKSSKSKVLLPIKQAPEGVEEGGELEVFIYRDSKDRLIATTNTPKLKLGEVARLKVAQLGKIGAFLDWGLEKDLLLPFREQTAPLKEGGDCLAALYIDKSDRLCATMRLYKYLRQDSEYNKDDRVSGTVYEISDNFGAFVAVDDIYSALIPKNELYGDIHVGDRIEARVTGVKEDGKLNLSIREKAYLQMGKDAEKILEILDDYGGALPFSDKASPELIKSKTGMSKNEFKRAVGHLLKEKKITIGNSFIRKI